MWELRPFSAGSIGSVGGREATPTSSSNEEPTAGPGNRVEAINRLLTSKAQAWESKQRRRESRSGGRAQGQAGQGRKVGSITSKLSSSVIQETEMDWKMRQQKREAISGRFWARIDRSKSKDTIPDEDSTIFPKSLPSKHSHKTKMRSGLQDLLFEDDRNPLSDAESAVYSDSGEDDLDLVAVTIEKVKCRRVGTSMGLSHFFGSTTRNSVTGRIVMKEDRYLPGFLLVDIFGRRRLVGSPRQLWEDHYIFRPYVMANRTWIYHKYAKDPSKLATVNAKDSMNGMIKKILELQCVDVDINSGRHSPLMLWMVCISFIACTGDAVLVSISLVTTALMCFVTYTHNTPEKYNWVRLWLLPLRLAAGTGIVLRTMELTDFVSVIVFSSLSLLTLVVDFVFGDMFMLWSYRFECSYKVLDELPDRVFLCSRRGAAHLDDVMGARLAISTEVTGSAWDPRYSLIADIRGLLCELRRPRLEELQELIETFQESQEDFGFFSVKCFSSDRPNYAALEPDIPIRDLEKIIEKHRKEYPWTWSMISKPDLKFPERRGAEVLEFKKALLAQ